MTPVLRSFTHDTWQDGGGPARPLLDAATGETVALLPETGPDPATMLGHARRVGGPALGALTFTERAAILKALAKHLSGHLEEFAQLSTRTGATRRDTAVDVDGGIGTLAVHASKAARELPDAAVLPDGATEPLGRGGTFAGRHVLVPRQGVAVQINAYNFPVWGMLEKFAPAFLDALTAQDTLAFVPSALADAVCGAVSERLERIVVDPCRDGTDMGPLAGLDRRDEVRAAVARLSAEAKLVCGDPGRVEVAGADPERGASIAPILLRCDDPSTAAPHEVEAFGPVSTLLPYDDLDEVIGAAALGGGSLAGSIVTADPEAARTLVRGLAPWHGRLLVLNRDDAAESTGHGVAMPQMLHGGPGRAGGGEELGGLRALDHYLRRTAVQGHPDFLDGLA
ncbi:aldehyde dehydrogenase family protein [Actinomadura rugatobispora]|uniref:Aldehyde dehydrogenase family protein n=1 Tax=Actinomadura rugatobispora TaxID=1994 RepID=A0ABW0ZYN5_9ACTN|nr:hypothetical protein GCM10010200_091610 [Actinomadura rugatobispora]